MGLDIHVLPQPGTATSPGVTPRIALFTDTFWEVNGAAHTLRKIAEVCEQQKISLDVYTYAESHEVFERGSVRILCFDHRFSNNYYEKLRFELIPDFRIGDRWRRRMHQTPYTAVHLATPGSMGIAGRILAHRHRIPMLGTYHTHLADYVALRSFQPVRGLMRKACWRFMKWFYRPCRTVLAPTDGVLEELQTEQFHADLGIFTRGVDTDLYSDRKRRRPEDRVVASYVGRCAPEKNVAVLPEVMRDLDVEMWVVGDGPERPRLERELQGARFTGYLHGEELAQAYADSDLLLFPSQTDTFGNVVLEAMASGVVPIVSDGPGPSSFVTHRVNAMVCQGARAMREAVCQLAKDPDARRSMRRKAREFAEGRSWRTAINALIDQYRMLAPR